MRGLWLWLCTFLSFPNLLYLCSYANFRAFLFGAILVHARHRETTGVLNGSPQSGFGLDWIVSWVIAVLVGSGCCSGLKEDFTFYIFGFWTLDFDKCNR